MNQWEIERERGERKRDQLTVAVAESAVALKTEETATPGDFVSRPRQRRGGAPRRAQARGAARWCQLAHLPETLTWDLVACGVELELESNRQGRFVEGKEAIPQRATAAAERAGNGQGVPATVKATRCRESSGREGRREEVGVTVGVEPDRSRPV